MAVRLYRFRTLVVTLVAIAMLLQASPASATEPAHQTVAAEGTPATALELGLTIPPSSAERFEGEGTPLSAYTTMSASEPGWAHDLRDPNDVHPDLLAEATRLASELAALNGTAPAFAADAATPTIRFFHDPNHRELHLATTAQEIQLTAPDRDGFAILTRTLLALDEHFSEEGIPPLNLTFAPPLEHRSIHLDIARKHYSPEAIRGFIDEAAWAGLNELELHFSEFEGFAIESERYPDIASPDALSKDEVRQLVNYGAARGVRLSPSLDMPGHLEHVLDTHPEFRLQTGSGQDTYGGLDITNPEAVAFADNLIGEYAELFPKGSWNLGADEFVDFDDADEVARLTAHAQANHGPTATAFDALTEFVNGRAAKLAELGFTTRVWSDGMLRGSVVTLDPAIEVAYWTTRPEGVATTDAFAAGGHPLINVNDEFLYFVLGERVGYAYPTGERIFESWTPETFPSLGDTAQEAEAAGAMFAIWSDIPDALSDAEVLERARPGIRAMAWKLAAGGEPAEAGWTEFAASTSEPAPAVAQAELPAGWGESIEVPADEDAAAAPAGSPEVPWWMVWTAGVLAVGLALAVISRRKHRHTA